MIGCTVLGTIMLLFLFSFSFSFFLSEERMASSEDPSVPNSASRPGGGL